MYEAYFLSKSRFVFAAYIIYANKRHVYVNQQSTVNNNSFIVLRSVVHIHRFIMNASIIDRVKCEVQAVIQFLMAKYFGTQNPLVSL